MFNVTHQMLQEYIEKTANVRRAGPWVLTEVYHSSWNLFFMQSSPEIKHNGQRLNLR